MATYLTKWGANGTGNGQFSHIVDLSIDGAGNVYVPDPANNRVEKFGP